MILRMFHSFSAKNLCCHHNYHLQQHQANKFNPIYCHNPSPSPSKSKSKVQVKSPSLSPSQESKSKL